MPDISLLQSDYEVVLKESRIPSIFLTVSIILLVVSIGSYVGLFFYHATLAENLKQVSIAIESLSIENASNEAGRLSKMGGQLDVIQYLRELHTDANASLAVIAKSVHPKVYYKDADINLVQGEAKLTGIALTPKSLSEQVMMYAGEKNILSYDISNISLVNDNVKFELNLKIKK
ncbi:MAG: hypothetical protein AAB614_00035 [Patescibacteria group bacterium]